MQLGGAVQCHQEWAAAHSENPSLEGTGHWHTLPCASVADLVFTLHVLLMYT